MARTFNEGHQSGLSRATDIITNAKVEAGERVILGFDGDNDLARDNMIRWLALDDVQRTIDRE